MIEINLNFPSCALMRPVEIRAILPYGFAAANPPCRVVWALHCAMADGGVFFNQLGAGRLADSLQTAIIAPSLGNGFFFNSSREKQADFLEEMLLALREILPLSARREDNATLGISMGGFGAVRWAWTSGCFFKAVAISGMFNCLVQPHGKISSDRNQKNLYRIFSGAMRELMLAEDGGIRQDCDFGHMAANVKEPACVDLYCGDSDYLSLPQNLYLQELAASRGLPLNMHSGPGGHSMDYWARILPVAMGNIFNAGQQV